MPLDCKLFKYVSLLDLYKQGWWVTERFGSTLTLVKPRAYKKDGFACRVRRFTTDVSFDTLDEQIKIIADKKYECYKKYLNDQKQKYEWWNDVNNLPVLQKRNRSADLLLSTQKRTSRKIQTKQK